MDKRHFCVLPAYVCPKGVDGRRGASPSLHYEYMWPWSELNMA